MLTFKTFRVIFFWFSTALFLFFNCITDKTPVGNITNFDRAIMGDWYHVSSPSQVGMPPLSYNGMRVNEEGVVDLLTIEIATGKLVLSNEPAAGKFRRFYNGDFTLEVFQRGFARIGGLHHSIYEIKDNKIYFPEANKIPEISSNYTKTEVGTIIAEPVQTRLEMLVRDTHFINSATGSIPTAYAGYIPQTDGEVQFHIYGRNTHFALNIYLNNFSGAGEYILGTTTMNDANYRVLGGDVIYYYPMLEEIAGYVTVTHFDFLNKRCSGNFNFRLGEYELTDFVGNFDIPVYE